MAPDVNSLPSSPRADRPQPPPPPAQTAQPPPSSLPTSTSASRRASQTMGPPAALATTTTTTIHGHQVHRSPVISSNEQLGIPLRHPRPLTAAELYLECEKEQEAVRRVVCVWVWG
ncbi:hypothetical protein BAUCODRAFT_37983 [Baudoinia panamericana UAMH 10762]|uniref:Uncharacterized protein n=1 Tax=Baudoinia panamericana (strain UAMH 10762) TaxID=717646 RepID=M2N256_BAUPA|nr:uncharacterized protein BAUCODRAFT_37983 [Baudoinia panamericana UAMH 10762]EMC93064.1 hypothetical protein BAUCODRAFT_37983 [Baudoinia panamericana UAMH 10762]